jgi:tRNA uracil 4-sulfurtransferase
MYDVLLVRYGEMTLKKTNYKDFQQQMNRNIRNKCKHLKNISFSGSAHRFYIHLNGEDYREVVKVLETIVGLASYSLCIKTKSTYEEIIKHAILLLQNHDIQENETFKVETNRSDKRFPDTSIEVSRKVATEVLRIVKGLKVDVHHPTLQLSIDLRREGSFLYLQSNKGLGGYPGGSAGSGLLMMSGGIDSPVAGFLALKKGVNLTAIHFASPPYTSKQSLQKVIELLEKLAKYTASGSIELIVVPFTKIQEKIQTCADFAYFVTIMRRVMVKIADEVARKKRIHVLINGESIGQVASQTLESMQVVNQVTNRPILRPLVTYDKEEIINIARKIDTFDISIRPFEDCCTVFIPEHPVIKPTLTRVLSEEKRCDLKELVLEAIENIESIPLSCYSSYQLDQDREEECFDK